MALLGYSESKRWGLDEGRKFWWQVLQAILPFRIHCSVLPSHWDANWSASPCIHHHHWLTSLTPWAMIHNSHLKAVLEHLGSAKAKVKWRQISLPSGFTSCTAKQAQSGEAVVLLRQMKGNNGNMYGDWVKTMSSQVRWLQVEQSHTGPCDKSN